MGQSPAARERLRNVVNFHWAGPARPLSPPIRSDRPGDLKTFRGPAARRGCGKISWRPTPSRVVRIETRSVSEGSALLPRLRFGFRWLRPRLPGNLAAHSRHDGLTFRCDGTKLFVSVSMGLSMNDHSMRHNRFCTLLRIGLLGGVLGLPGLGRAAVEKAPFPTAEDFMVVSGPASPRVACAIARGADRFCLVLDVAVRSADAGEPGVSVGLAAAHKVILTQQQAELQRSDGRLRYVFSLAARELVDAEADWDRLRPWALTSPGRAVPSAAGSPARAVPARRRRPTPDSHHRPTIGSRWTCASTKRRSPIASAAS